MEKKTTGEIIKELREQRGLTQEELAELIGKTNTYIAMIESGHRKGKYILDQIAEALEVDVEVLEGSKPVPPYKPRMKPLKSMMREFELRFDSLGIREIPVLCRVPFRGTMQPSYIPSLLWH